MSSNTAKEERYRGTEPPSSIRSAPGRPVIEDALTGFDPDLPALKIILGRAGFIADSVLAARVGRWWAGRLLALLNRLEGEATVGELRRGVQAWLASSPPER
jgi:hypothetical protein